MRVTPLRRSSRWTGAQSGSGLRRMPGLRPRPAYRAASRTSSVTVSGSGQLRPAAPARSSTSAIVERATRSERAMARSVAPLACLRRRMSRICRIDTLLAGIGLSWWSGEGPGCSPGVERTSPQMADFVVEYVADFKSEPVADFIPEHVADLLRNQHARTSDCTDYPGIKMAANDLYDAAAALVTAQKAGADRGG